MTLELICYGLVAAHLLRTPAGLRRYTGVPLVYRKGSFEGVSVPMKPTFQRKNTVDAAEIMIQHHPLLVKFFGKIDVF